jgi:hypothetical protein
MSGGGVQPWIPHAVGVGDVHNLVGVLILGPARPVEPNRRLGVALVSATAETPATRTVLFSRPVSFLPSSVPRRISSTTAVPLAPAIAADGTEEAGDD